jgi:transposase
MYDDVDNCGHVTSVQQYCSSCGRLFALKEGERHHLCRTCNIERLHAALTPLPPSPPPSSSSPPSIFGRPDQCIDQLSLIERAAIITLHQVGWTGRDIAKELHCSENTVSLWLNRWKEDHSLLDKERSGRPRCTTDDLDQDIMIYSDSHVNKLPKDLVRELDLPVSARTVRRRLNEIGLGGFVRRYEYDFNEFDIQRRLAFAHEYEHWTEDDWSHVFFSDEVPFYLGQHGREYVQRPEGMACDPKYSHPLPQLNGKVSLWGCICTEGLGYAELFSGSLNSTQHRDILRHNLLPAFKQFFPTGPWYFQQDNARFHTTAETIEFLHNKGITSIEWPPWSPDLNPIEDLWNVLKQRVYSHYPQTMEELEHWIGIEWAATELTFISHLCNSMPKRIKLLLAAEGHKIPY